MRLNPRPPHADAEASRSAAHRGAAGVRELPSCYPLLALALMAIDIANSLVPVSAQGVWLVLIFVWIGQWQPPRTEIGFGPVAALACALPFAFGTPITSDAVGAIAIAVPVAVLVGETIARKETSTRLDRAILDLDHFKQVNDRLGHQAGDQVLRDLGCYLREAVRGFDRVARFGGEEFIIVLRDPSTSAQATITRVLAGWQATGPITTLSSGLAIHHAGQPPAVTFADADAALYDAKQAGRDRLVVHRPGVQVHRGDRWAAPIA